MNKAMNPSTFTSQVRRFVIEESLDLYKELFHSTAPEAASDPYMTRALTLFRDLGDDQQSVFFEVIRQVMSDTVSHLMGVLDGVNVLEDPDCTFLLVEDGGTEALNGDLQDLFLALEEEEP